VVPTAEEDLDLTVADSRNVTVRNAAVMSVGTAISRITGIARLLVTLAALGVTASSDAYNTANTTPNIIYELVLGGILTSVFVPVFVDWARARGREASWEVAGRLLTLAMVVLTVVAGLGAVFAPWIMRLYLTGESDPLRRSHEIELGTFFLRWFMPQIVFYGLGAVATGVLTANRRFAVQMFAPVLNNVAVIATMLAFIAMRHGAAPGIATISATQKTMVAAGTTFGVFAMTIALWPALRSIGFRWRLRFDWRHETVRRLLSLAKWVVLYVIANQLAYIVIINLNYRLPFPGAYTAYSQAFIFFSLPHAIVAVSIFTALLPGMAERWSLRTLDGVRDLFSRGLRDTEVVMLPAAAGLIVLAGPLMALLADHGAVTGSDRALLARTLAAFAVGLPFFSAFQLLTRTFYAMQDTRTPALVNCGAAVVNLLADVVFTFGFGWGVPGLALGHAASYLVGSCVLFLIVRNRLGGADETRIASTIARTFAAAASTAAAAFLVAEAIQAVSDVDRPGVRLLQVGGSVAAGVLVFFGVALIVRIEEVDEVKKALLGRFRR
jgi:putative peptidoglycan lipid II flippase